MFFVAYTKTQGSFADICLVAWLTGVFVNPFLLKGIWPGFIFGTENILKFLASCEEGIAASLLKGALEPEGYAAWDERNFGIGAK